MFFTLMHPVFVIVACLAAGDPPDRPPPLTFDKHVDYIAWYNDFAAAGKKDNAYDSYQALTTGENGRPGIANPEGPAAEQLNKATHQAWMADDYKELAAYLKDCAPYLENYRKAVKHHDYWQPAPPETKKLYDLAFPTITASRASARAVIAQALMKQDGQPKLITEACRVVLRNADHMQQWGILIGSLVCAAERSQVCRLVCAALADGAVDGQDAAKLYATIHRYDPGPPDMARWLVFEWAAMLDVLQSLCPKGELDAGAWKEIRQGIEKADPAADKSASKPFDPKEAAQLIDAFFAAERDIVAGPPSLATARKLEAFEKEQRPKVNKNSFIAIFAPTYARAYHLHLRSEAEHRATLLILALHAHHAKHGKWPESLAKIDKKLGLKGLKEARQDPFSGNDFIYKIKDGQPFLYTVATDGDDDGGRHDTKWGETDSDYVFWPFQR